MFSVSKRGLPHATDISAKKDHLIFTVQDEGWRDRFVRGLDDESGHVARESLRSLQGKAAKSNADALGFKELITSGFEAIVFRRYLTMDDERTLQRLINNARGRIRRLTRFRDAEFPLWDERIPLEMRVQLPSFEGTLRIRAELAKWIEGERANKKMLGHQLAGQNEKRANPKQDTFAVARLRAGLLMCTGSQYDSHVAGLLTVASRAANRRNDTWSEGQLQKITDRFVVEYRAELPELLIDELCLMHLQVYPAQEWSVQSWLPVMSFVHRLCAVPNR